MTIKSLEAEARLGFIADVSMLFADKGQRGHIHDLVKIAEGGYGEKKMVSSKLVMEGSNGQSVEVNRFIPGVTYIVE